MLLNNELTRAACNHACLELSQRRPLRGKRRGQSKTLPRLRNSRCIFADQLFLETCAVLSASARRQSLGFHASNASSRVSKEEKALLTLSIYYDITAGRGEQGNRTRSLRQKTDGSNFNLYIISIAPELKSVKDGFDLADHGRRAFLDKNKVT